MAKAGGVWKLFGSLVANAALQEPLRRRVARVGGPWWALVDEECFVGRASPPARRSSGCVSCRHGCRRETRALAARPSPTRSQRPPCATRNTQPAGRGPHEPPGFRAERRPPPGRIGRVELGPPRLHGGPPRGIRGAESIRYLKCLLARPVWSSGFEDARAGVARRPQRRFEAPRSDENDRARGAAAGATRQMLVPSPRGGASPVHTTARRLAIVQRLAVKNARVLLATDPGVSLFTCC